MGSSGGTSLSFKDDRLVLIAVYGSLVERLTFDNGLKGNMSRAECIKLLGPPDMQAPDPRESLYVGDIVYRAKEIRADLGFNTWQQRGSVRSRERLHSIAVRLEQEARRTLTKEDLLRVWSAPEISVWECAAAVNRWFTNGTPISTVVALLGTNHTRFTPISTVWLGPGPEPRKTSGLMYRFGNDYVIVHTTADVMGDPLSGEFAGAGYSVDSHPQRAKGVWIGQREGAPDWNKPFSLETNRTSAPIGSRR